MRAALVILVLLAAGIAAGWQYTGRAATPPGWKLAAATRGPIQSAVLATGTLKPVVTVQVGSQISGQIVKLEADYNTPVSESQVIARLDPATYRARVEQARADLAVAEATIKMQEAGLERARTQLRTAENAAADTERTLARTEQLAKSGFATEKQLQTDRLAASQSRIAIDAARAQIRMAEADLVVAQAQVQQRRAMVSIAETDLDRTVIRSPVNGVVVNRQVDIGQTVAASLQAPTLFEIAQDLKDMRLEASVDEADIGRVGEGQTAVFTVDAYPGRRFEGRVRQVRKAPKVVQNVTTYTVVIEAANPRLELLPGMTANVRIVQARKEDAVKIPAAALRFRPESEMASSPERAPDRGHGGGPDRAERGAGGGGDRPGGPRRGRTRGEAEEAAIYVPGENGAAQRVPVTVGLSGDNEVEVVAGLEAGQSVIVGRAESAAPRRMRSPFGF